MFPIRPCLDKTNKQTNTQQKPTGYPVVPDVRVEKFCAQRIKAAKWVVDYGMTGP